MMTWLYWAAAIYVGVCLVGYLTGDEGTSPGRAKVVVLCAVGGFVALVVIGALISGGHNMTRPWD